MRFAAFLLAGLAVTLALAFAVSPQASSQPDGLEKVAIAEGFADTEEAHALRDLPTAGYAVEGIDDARLSTGVAGVVGVGATVLLMSGVLLLVRRVSRSSTPSS